MALLLGWRFVLGEFIGGPVMILLVALLFRLLLKRGLVDAARAEANKGRLGSMEGHAEMDMSIHGDRGLLVAAASDPCRLYRKRRTTS